MKTRVLFTAMLLLLAARFAPGQKAIATNGTNWNGVTVDLMTVERKGSVLTVKWAVHNQGSGATRVKFDLLGGTITTYAVDEEHGAKYYVLTDKEKHALASASEYTGSGEGISESIPAGENRRYWMKLPAPPAEVKKITLLLTNMEPFEDVTITDK